MDIINLSIENNEINDKKSYCINCGKNGHISKKCLCPIISIGIICIKINIDDIDLNSIIIYLKKIQSNYLFSIDEINRLKKLKSKLHIFIKNINNNIEYLLIRRRHSLNYVEFIRGKYDVYNLDYLIKSFNFITTTEKDMIKNNDFDYLWKNLWGNDINNNEYNESKEKFNLLKTGFYIKKNEINIFISINILIENSIYNYTEPEWGYPKGRRNMKEKNIECAKREFEEETLINIDNINIINITPLEETYIASNGLKYKHIYYISQIKNKNIELNLDFNNVYQKIEVSGINWFKFYDAIKILRDYNIEKKNILLNLHYNIKYMIENLIICIENKFND
jgi:8-oxo-dGTP pyrophosphatase MutT (NUDIX family)